MHIIYNASFELEKMGMDDILIYDEKGALDKRLRTTSNDLYNLLCHCNTELSSYQWFFFLKYAFRNYKGIFVCFYINVLVQGPLTGIVEPLLQFIFKLLHHDAIFLLPLSMSFSHTAGHLGPPLQISVILQLFHSQT